MPRLQASSVAFHKELRRRLKTARIGMIVKGATQSV